MGVNQEVQEMQELVDPSGSSGKYRVSGSSGSSGIKWKWYIRVQEIRSEVVQVVHQEQKWIKRRRYTVELVRCRFI
jgi:hypothetical protein